MKLRLQAFFAVVWLFCAGYSQAQTAAEGAMSTATELTSASVSANGQPKPADEKAPAPLKAAEKMEDKTLAASPPAKAGEAKPSQPETEFQSFVFESTGKVLPMYGYDMFSSAPSTFAPVDHAPVTPDYLVGPGDEIYLRVWGQVDADLKIKVDRLGQIYIPKVGNVNVAGLRYQELTNAIRGAIGKNFRNFDLEVSLGQLKAIQVYLVGQAKHPGSYTLSSLSTLVNALFASGGPSDQGSMRRIELKRQGKTVAVLDLYDFLLKGDKSGDAQLQPGDVIYIPPIGPVAAISGSVHSPAIYELKDGTDLSSLIAMAGGLSATAAGQRAEVERVEKRKDRIVENFPMDAEGLKRGIRDGDVVRVMPISPRFENDVALRGNVAYPFRAPWHKGMRIKDLIPDKDMLITRDYWLKKNRAERATGIGQLIDEIKRPVSEINWDYAVIERLNWKDLSTSFIPFNLGKAVEENDPEQNIALEPGDVVTVFSKEDMKIPVEKQSRLIRIEGEVKNAGVYKAKPGETLRELLARIGGLTPDAYLYGSEFTRESTRKFQEQKLKEIVGRIEREMQSTASAQAARAISPEDTAALKEQTASRQAMLDRLKTLKPTGRIVLELPPDAHSVKDIPDIALEDGDRFYVPATPSTVGVFGEVYNENNAFIYKDGKTVSDYLASAGGVAEGGDADRVFVVRADGSVVSRQAHRGGIFSGSFDSKKLMPGDAVVVPPEIDRISWMREFKDWTTILSQFALGAAALRVLRM